MHITFYLTTARIRDSIRNHGCQPTQAMINNFRSRYLGYLTRLYGGDHQIRLLAEYDHDPVVTPETRDNMTDSDLRAFRDRLYDRLTSIYRLVLCRVTMKPIPHHYAIIHDCGFGPALGVGLSEEEARQDMLRTDPELRYDDGQCVEITQHSFYKILNGYSDVVTLVGDDDDDR